MKSTSIAVLILCSLCFVTKANSHDGATGIVKERMDSMSDMSDATKLVADMYKGKIEFNNDAIAAAIASYQKHGGKMHTQFPDTEHSRTGSKTDALPKIWLAPEAFTDKINAFVLANEALSAAFNDGASEKQLKKRFLTTAKTCSGCHKQFRKRKKK